MLIHIIKPKHWVGRLTLFLIAALLTFVFTSQALSYHTNFSFKWQTSDENPPRAWWNAAFAENQTTWSQFPSNTRHRIRTAAWQWDDVNNPGSSLNFDETSNWGTTELEVHPAPFSIMALADIPGDTDWTFDEQENTVTHAITWLNQEWNWNTETNNTPARKADVQTIELHEMGHVIGFKHPCEIDLDQPSPVTCDSSTVMAIITVSSLGEKRAPTSHDRFQMAIRYDPVLN